MFRWPILRLFLILTILTVAVLLFQSARFVHFGRSTSEPANVPSPFPTRDPIILTSTRAPTPSVPPSPMPAVSLAAALAREESSTPTPLPHRTDLPEEHYIRNITGHKQYFALGCEAAAAKDWAKFLGYDFNEFEFQYKLPISDNPEFGFVGNVNSPWGQVPPYAYGVYAGPVADLLDAYGIPAKADKGFTLDQIKSNIALDKPVIVWVIGNIVGGIPSVYTDSKGNKTTVAAYEHVVIVT